MASNRQTAAPASRSGGLQFSDWELCLIDRCPGTLDEWLRRQTDLSQFEVSNGLSDTLI